MSYPKMELNEIELRRLIKLSYQRGWCDCIAGDDVRSVDYQSEDQIIEQCLKDFKSEFTKSTPKGLRKLLMRVITEDSIDDWVNKPNVSFANRKPIDVWYSHDRQQIIDMVGRLEHGVFG